MRRQFDPSWGADEKIALARKHPARASCVFAAHAIKLGGVLAFYVLVVAPLHWLLIRCGYRSEAIPRSFARSIARALRMRIVVEGRGCTIKPALIVSNHVSWLDIMAVAATFPVSFLARHDVESWPIVGWLARMQDTIFVDRGDRRAVPAVNTAVADVMRRGRSVLLFPEGTTGENLSLGPFHSAHFAPALLAAQSCRTDESIIVQPIAIYYSWSAAAWVGDMTLADHIAILLRGPAFRCHIVFAEAFSVDPRMKRQALASVARQRIVDCLEHARVGSAAPKDLTS